MNQGAAPCVWQTLRQAARRSPDGIEWARETKVGGINEAERGSGGEHCHNWAFAMTSPRTRDAEPAPAEKGVEERLGVEKGSVQECRRDLGPGLSPAPEFSDVVVLQVRGGGAEMDCHRDGGDKVAPQRVSSQHALRVAAILSQNRLRASAPQGAMHEEVTSGDALSRQILRALAETHVLVLVVQDASGGPAHAGHDAARDARDEQNVAAGDNGKHGNAYVCDWLSRFRQGLAGAERGRGPQAIFGLALDGSTVPVCEAGWGRFRVQWFHKKTPLQTSIAIDQVRSVFLAKGARHRARFCLLPVGGGTVRAHVSCFIWMNAAHGLKYKDTMNHTHAPRSKNVHAHAHSCPGHG